MVVKLDHPLPAEIPAYDTDFYADAFIADPHPHYSRMRALGPVVWLPVHGNYALTRYAEVRSALKDAQIFRSGEGVAADQAGCDFMKGNTVASDEPEHTVMRSVVARPLLPDALEGVRDRIEQAADDLIRDLVRRERFDGMADLARHLPLTIVTELVGLPEDGRANMLKWAAGGFDILGVQNERGRRGVETVREMRRYISTHAVPDKVRPGSWTDRIFRLAREGRIPRDLCPSLIRDYIGPSLDTTIAATGQLLLQLGNNPDQWARLRVRPELILNAVNEAVRLASPIRSFTRFVSREHEIGGAVLPAGARVMLLFASANRDDRVFVNADSFDVERSDPPHVGFGHGSHTCVGMHLARMEMEALLKAMVRHVESIETGHPTVAYNNTIASFETLPVFFVESATKVEPAPKGEASPERDGNWLSALVAAKKCIAEDIVELQLRPEATSILPSFTAGAHVDIEVAPGIVRQYSLCGDPADTKCYRIAVLREPDSRGGSRGIHECLPVGASVRISRPRNTFPLDETAMRNILLAGGIGITPLMAMAYRLTAIQSDFELHYCARTIGRVAFLDELRLAFGNRFQLHLDDGDAAQRLDLSRLLAIADLQTHLYACGPAGFLSHVRSAAAAAGRPQELQHFEYFGADPDMSGRLFRVIALRSGAELDVPSGKTILEVLTEAGIHVPSSCHSGVCGSCLTKVVEGVPEHRDSVLSSNDKALNKRMAICCSRSLSPVLVLDV